ncbi:MAG: A/G-specific adenine glycosylase [Alphaproteobacteria bacterium]|nr:A/G-specific adenine glycosylase [Alphaproteobacteria bacterium]
MTAASSTSATPFPGRAALLAWYDQHRRTLPWRMVAGGALPDPYHVWLSEVMLQQTTVATVRQRFPDFLAEFPTLQQLAVAPLDDVLRAWAGLGYYRRAHQLHAAAQMLWHQHGGVWPHQPSLLAKLPGFGAYTAAAVAAIAFEQPVLAVDTNVARVMARLFCLPELPPALNKSAAQAGAGLVAPHRCGDLVQAVMELGSLVCRARQPSCDLCPLRQHCQAYQRGVVEDYPRVAPKLAKPTRYVIAWWLQDGQGQSLWQRRPDQGLLAGLWSLPLSPFLEAEPDDGLAASLAPLPTQPSRLVALVRHSFTHFHLQLSLYHQPCPFSLTSPNSNSNSNSGGSHHPLPPAYQQGRWLSLQQLPEIALPTLMTKVAARMDLDF